MSDQNNTIIPWILVAASSLACCFGASIVFLDSLNLFSSSGEPFKLEASPRFLAASLSLASGVMTFSALFTLLPEALETYERATPLFQGNSSSFVLLFYFLGVAFTLLVNATVRFLTPGGSCPCEGDVSGEDVERSLEHGGRKKMNNASNGPHRGHAHHHDANGCDVHDRSDQLHHHDRGHAQHARGEGLGSQTNVPRPESQVRPEPSTTTTRSAPPSKNHIHHCKGLYEDHAFLHHHNHCPSQTSGSTTPELHDRSESPLFNNNTHADDTQPTRKYGTFAASSRDADAEQRNDSKTASSPAPQHSILSKDSSTTAGSLLPHYHHQNNRHHHHFHTHKFPYQNVPYKCSSNSSLDQHQRNLETHSLDSPQPGGSRHSGNDRGHRTSIDYTSSENSFAEEETRYAPDSKAPEDSIVTFPPEASSEADNASSDCSILSQTNACVQAEQQDRQELLRIGVQTAAAISLHKFPEGLITFVGAKASPSMGYSVFFAIFIHNIPEGLMIAVPLLVATSSRLKAFLLASLLGGLSQPIGALLGYYLLPSSDPGGPGSGPDEAYVSSVYGSLFAFISGLMTCVVVQGMFPAAVRFDSQGNIVTAGFFSGVALVGLSWALFGEH